jgi:hypothetical protein
MSGQIDASPQPPDFDVRVKLAIYRHFADTTRRPEISDITRAIGASPEDIRAAYGRLFKSRVLVLEGDRTSIRMAPPFSGVPTQHRVGMFITMARSRLIGCSTARFPPHAGGKTSFSREVLCFSSGRRSKSASGAGSERPPAADGTDGSALGLVGCMVRDANADSFPATRTYRDADDLRDSRPRGRLLGSTG